MEANPKIEREQWITVANKVILIPLPGENIDLVIDIYDKRKVRLWGITAPIPPFDSETRAMLGKLVAIQEGHSRTPWEVIAKPTVVAHVLENGRVYENGRLLKQDSDEDTDEKHAMVHLYNVQDDKVQSINESLVAEGLACPTGDVAYCRFARADARARARARGIYRF